MNLSKAYQAYSSLEMICKYQLSKLDLNCSCDRHGKKTEPVEYQNFSMGGDKNCNGAFVHQFDLRQETTLVANYELQSVYRNVTSAIKFC